jgi:DNA-binding transcriptional LysR family regulator
MIKQRSNAVEKRAPALRISALEARRRASLDRISWDNMRLLLMLSECGSFRSAAIVAGISLNTIRSKIERLERQIGGPLIRRSVEGVTLTQEGYEMVSIARQMRELGKSAERVQVKVAAERGSVVRMTITEGLGTFWLVPHLAGFRSRNPEVHIDVKCDMMLPDVLFRDVDISVQLEPPANPDLVVQKIGTLHLMPFASESYLHRFGTPASISDAKNHKLVWQDADQVESGLLPNYVDSAVINNGLIAVTTSTSSAHYWAVTKGAGIGFLPSYVRAISRRPQPLDIGVQLRRPIYLVHHPDAARFPEVRLALDWIRESFDNGRYPWFADDFVHPDQFEKQAADADIAKLFEVAD